MLTLSPIIIPNKLCGLKKKKTLTLSEHKFLACAKDGSTLPFIIGTKDHDYDTQSPMPGAPRLEGKQDKGKQLTHDNHKVFPEGPKELP